MASSDSSSDDENSQLLREAVDTQFINDEMFNFTNNHNGKASVKQKATNVNDLKKQPSLRPKKNEDDQFNTLDVTPQFRIYVAKQLTKFLDEQLVYNVKDSKIHKRKRKGGIKLLSDSNKFIKIKKSNDKILTLEHNKKKTVENKSSDSDNEQKCSEVAVNPDDILNKKDVKNWSTRSKAPIFRYKKTENGTLTSIE